MNEKIKNNIHKSIYIKSWYQIDPNSIISIVWDIIQAILYIFLCIELPATLTFKIVSSACHRIGRCQLDR